jgi:hypothetical protein
VTGEALRKALLYLRPTESYWRRAAGVPSVDAPEPYPLVMAQRLDEGHVPAFDPEGVPLWPGSAGSHVYFVTTIAAYALGCWERAEAGDSAALDRFLAAARRLLALARPEVGGLVLRNAQLGGIPEGHASAMSQGQAMSVLVRAWRATGEERFGAAAVACVVPFHLPISAGGVVGRVESAGLDWYEEYAVRPLGHVLNGMVFALWGLRDVASAMNDIDAGALFEAGADAVERLGSRFDTGFWSRYWLPEDSVPDLIASMMYHNLHVAQLRALAAQAGRPGLAALGDRFADYGRSPTCRVRAALAFGRSTAGRRPEVA